MSSIFIWLAAIVLEGVPLVRALRVGFASRYKLFYSYLSFVLVRDLCLLVLYHWFFSAYAWTYWYTEFLSVLLGCGVVWESYKIALAAYPGAARIARSALPVLFIFVTMRIVVEDSLSANWIPGRTTLQTEVELRVVQVVLLLGLVAVFAYYAIPLGRNLKGIVYGYGLFLGTNLTGLTLREDLGSKFQSTWQHMQPGSYLIILLLWCVTLWFYNPLPQRQGRPNLEKDYEALVTGTKSKLRIVRDLTSRAIRS
ncbi:MAG: hypothetical protein ACRD8A_16650 [Candidatus Acidiferrales bacterium]